MAKKLFMKGNDAIVVGALMAGCRAYYGYPITPASEIAHAAALHFPALGGTFIQAESEVAAINMCYGTAGMGIRVMTASSSPGVSLKQEGLSYCAGAELPVVIVNIKRAGPGLGNIAPEQGDYFQAVKGGGHGNYRLLVLAPNSAQEMCDLTMLAFDLADRYRNPACVLADGFIGQMMEPVELPQAKPVPFDHTAWCVRGDAATRREPGQLHLARPGRARAAQPASWTPSTSECEANEVRFEEYQTADAELVVVAYGIVSRIVYSTVDEARARGLKVGLLRPITLWPFPSARLAELAGHAKAFLSVELSTGQMVEDVRLAVNGRRPVHFYGRCGGMVPTGRRDRGPVRADPEGGRAMKVTEKAPAFYDVFERKTGPARQATHYCPGCGHGNIHKMMAEALDGSGHRGAHGPGVARSAARVRLLLLRRGQHPGGARPGPGRGHRRSSGPTPTRSSSPTRATATWRPSAPPRSSTPPTAARTSRSSSSTTPSTA